MSTNLIVFVCTGNICRSPMAEYLFRDRLGDASNWSVQSAGVAAPVGSPASASGILAMREKDIDMARHKSQPLTPKLIDDAALIVVMTAGHQRAILDANPSARSKVFTLGSLSGQEGSGDIPDPIGLPLEIYVETRDAIDAALPRVQARLPEFGQNED